MTTYLRIAGITCSGLSSGLDQKKRTFYAGTLALHEQNSEGHVHAENRLMHKGSFQKNREKNLALLCTCRLKNPFNN